MNDLWSPASGRLLRYLVGLSDLGGPRHLVGRPLSRPRQARYSHSLLWSAAVAVSAGFAACGLAGLACGTEDDGPDVALRLLWCPAAAGGGMMMSLATDGASDKHAALPAACCFACAVTVGGYAKAGCGPALADAPSDTCGSVFADACAGWTPASRAAPFWWKPKIAAGRSSPIQHEDVTHFSFALTTCQTVTMFVYERIK